MKVKNPQVRLDDKTAARLNDYIASVWKKTRVKPAAKEIASTAINAWLDGQEKRGR